jgi:hypothetical protein
MKSRFRCLAALTFVTIIISTGCHTPPAPAYSVVTRPEIRCVAYADVPRRTLVQPRTHFAANEEIGVCILGFSGRTVNIELFEQRRGRIQAHTQTIPAPRMERRVAGYRYEPYLDTVRGVPVHQDVQHDVDWVLRLQLPPGNYEVRVTSTEGIQQVGSFVVSN